MKGYFPYKTASYFWSDLFTRQDFDFLLRKIYTFCISTLEPVEPKKGVAMVKGLSIEEMTREPPDTRLAFAGVDIGSLTSKSIVLLDGKIASFSIIPTAYISSEKSGLQALEEALKSGGLPRDELQYVVATGYGRISAPYAHKTVTEITCHAKGAYYLNPQARTVIDMGGQDCKVMRLDEQGNVTDFALNDKCAAGTGRFLEVMARVFEVSLEELGPLSLRTTERIAISSTCTVFAESEVISLMARGEQPDKIISGIHYAIAHRVAGMCSRVGVEADVVFSGGVAKNVGMKKALEEILGKPISPLNEDPQLVGALGAAIIARERGLRR